MIYQVINLKSSIFYKKVVIKNLNTGTIDTCYQRKKDIKWKEEKLVVGQKEHLNILLIGKVYGKNTDKRSRIYCELIDKNYCIDNQSYVQIAIGMDIYYIDQKEFEQSGIESNMFFLKLKRKELI